MQLVFRGASAKVAGGPDTRGGNRSPLDRVRAHTAMNGASNGAPAGGWASDSGWDTSLDRLSPTGGLRPLNVEHETSAPVPSQ